MEFFSRRPSVDKDNISSTVTQASTQSARVVERERARTALSHEARHDAMTGLPNRVSSDERARAAFARLQRSGKDSAMMVIDSDGFKAVNDKHGHHAGDASSIEVARRFNRVVAGLRGKNGWPGPSPRITSARVGGDGAGRAISSAVVAAARAAKAIEIWEDGRSRGSIRDVDGRVRGAVIERRGGRLDEVFAPAVVSATGGIGGSFEATTNPSASRGEGSA
ncbi:hypothetical protein OY671_008868, partial [Metschnikowia pulcherrima]